MFCSNRTFMELKLNSSLARRLAILCSNRTFMELKFNNNFRRINKLKF